MSISVGIVNDFEIVVRGLSEVLHGHDNIRVVEAVANLQVEGPVDILLYDNFSMEISGEALAAAAADPDIGAVVLYGWHLTPPVVRAALEAGVHGVISKRLTGDQLRAALERVAAGETVVVVDETENDVIGDWPGRPAGLSSREAEIVVLITQGMSNNEIAGRTFLSINSIKSYIRSAYRKMGVSNRSQAILWGIDNGMAQSRVRLIP